MASIIPDVDVLAFRMSIPYSDQFGHRGFSHSLLFAFAVALIGCCASRQLKTTGKAAFAFLFAAAASHGLLDMFTNGGLGVALFWPFSSARFFAPIRPIQVSPIGASRLLSENGLAVLWSELLWVWLPTFAIVLLIRTLRHMESRSIGKENAVK